MPLHHEAAVSLSEIMPSPLPELFGRHIVLFYYLYDYLQYFLNTQKCAHIKGWKHFHLNILSLSIPRMKADLQCFQTSTFTLRKRFNGKFFSFP